MNYMLSFPRSASSFIRYCVEKITNKRTLDCLGVHDRIYGINTPGPAILRKEHFVKDVKNKNDISSLILILRNYKDVYISHNLRPIPLSDIDTIYSRLYNSNNHHYFKEYYSLIDFYDKYEGDKLLLYYEDIISNPYESIKEVINFILPNDNIDLDKEEVMEYEKHSKKRYISSGGSKTLEVKKLHTVLTDEQNYEIDELFKEYNQDLYDKYLIRYLYKKL